MAESGQISSSIESKLRQAWREERRFVNVRGASRLLVWLIALIAIDFIIDWGLLSKPGSDGKNYGLILLVLNIGILGWVLWSEWLRHLKPFDPVMVALDVEQKHPDLASVLVSYTQLKGASSDQPNVSVDLIGAMRDQAIEKTRPLDFKEIVDFGQLKKLLAVAACLLLFFSIISIRWGDYVSALLQRLAGVNTPYPTETQIVDPSGAMTIRSGDPATVSARATGVIPEQGRVFTKPADGESDWKALPMKKSANAPTYERELKEITSDLLYYVQLGDGRSDTFRISVVAAPRVTEKLVTFQFPDYMGKGEETTDQLNVEVPVGTKISWKLACDPPVKNLDVKVGDKIITADKNSDGTELTFTADANESFKYTFRWTEGDSGQDFEYDDVQYNVRAVADTIPEIALLRPTSSGLATAEKTVTIAGRAADDHGLGEAWLVYTLDGSAEEKILIHKFEGVISDEFAYRWRISESIADLKSNAQINFAVEVTDKHPESTVHRRRSAERQLTIVDEKDYLDWYLAEVATQQEEIKRSREAERISSQKVKQIKNQEDSSERK